MITEGTVDADIYAMQQRKAEMTAAIFESENCGSDERLQRSRERLSLQENHEISYILKATVDRYLFSPSSKI